MKKATLLKNVDLTKVQLIVYDFDGVMTDNSVLISEDGSESVKVSRADGLGVSILKKLGYKQLIISTEENNVVRMRAEKLGIECFNGVANKAKVLKEYCSENNYLLKNTIFVGNDINDAQVMEIVGIPISPCDSHLFIKKISLISLSSSGGDGVIRELADIFQELKK